MPPSSHCSTRLPSACSVRGISRLASHGMIVSDTNSDDTTAYTTAIGSDRMYLPASPGRNSNGRKAKISVPVAPNTATPICLVPSIAASVRV